MKKKTEKKSQIKKIWIAVIAAFVILLSLVLYIAYQFVYAPNVKIDGQKNSLLLIPSGSNFDNVLSILKEENVLLNTFSFEWLAKQKNYMRKVKAGRYILLNGMSNNELLNMLRSGNQEPVRLSFMMARTKKEFAKKIHSQLEVDEEELIQLLNNADTMKRFGLTVETALTLFIPNTYEFYWNTSAHKFLQKMAESYKKFWNEERQGKAKAMGLSQSQVSILASIVQQETFIEKEKPIIAGVYYNRLKIKMPLQADPTLIWAAGDFSIKRVSGALLSQDSPYNTYIRSGLPPGPICLPGVKSLDAVLNYSHHNYLYFCAKEDFSGYSNYASNYAEHQRNARKYQAALNKRKLFR